MYRNSDQRNKIFYSGARKIWKDRSNIWREMKRLKEKAGVAESKIFPHNFRHLFARIYYKVTKDITGLADLLGHSKQYQCNENIYRNYRNSVPKEAG